jgi:3-oxoacyl-[acyl-carrier-protein] synthase-3
MTVVGIAGLGIYLPERVMTADEVAAASGIPVEVIRTKFGLHQKRIADVAGKGETASMMAAEAGRRALQDAGVDPEEVDAIIYFGSMHKDYYVWLAAPRIQELLGARRAYAFELSGASAGLPVALKVARSLMLADPSLHHVLLAAASTESMLIDYTNARARFMFNFGDGAAACVLRRGHPHHIVLESALFTDGRFAEFVRVPAGGSLLPPSFETIERRQHYLDVTDPARMKEMLDPVTRERFVRVIREALVRSGCHRLDFLVPLHTKRSLFQALLSDLGLIESQAIYLSNYGHLSAADPLLGLYLARQGGRLHDGDIVVLVSAGTGYSWGATVIRWGGAYE